MKNLLLISAKYNSGADCAALSLLNTLSNEAREKDRESYYKSLSGLARHLLEGPVFFQSLLKPAVPRNQEALKALGVIEGVSVPKGPLTEEQWKTFTASCKAADEALISFTAALKEEDLRAPVKVPFYKGNPEAVPLYFVLQNLFTHGVHHRGQISQILDELKIEHTYSSLKPELLG
ncbi:MAG: damage-inducible protein DinB [Spirochaetaceae bacterium]|jgi:uncharacterized damage-inducible protein DinB|nr:damage-inducible protein DinB [Spirochaetaceae bacterium]